MSKRKNKANTTIPLNVQNAKHRNDYIILFKHWVDKLSEKKVSQLIPKSEYDDIFNYRMHPILIINSDFHPIPKNEFEQLKKFNSKKLFKIYLISLLCVFLVDTSLDFSR